MTATGAAFFLTFIFTYYGGLAISIFVYPWRAGLNVYAWAGAFAQPGSRRNGIPWVIKSAAKVVGWPIVFVYWLAQGRPPSPVIFGPEAAERLYGDATQTLPGFMTKWTHRSRVSF